MIIASTESLELNKQIIRNVANAQLEMVRVSFIPRQVATFDDYMKQFRELNAIGRTDKPGFYYECDILD